MKPAPRYVSYYTPDYQPSAERLRRSLQKFDLPHSVLPTANLGSWQKNTQYKPRFLWERLAVSPGQPLVWVDADAVIRKRPAVFDSLEADIALVRWRRPHGKSEVLSGTVYLGGGSLSAKVVDRWIETCTENAELWDQRCLEIALECVPTARVVWLPVEYCFIFDTHRQAFPGIDPVIEHFQMSRETRARGGGGNETRALCC